MALQKQPVNECKTCNKPLRRDNRYGYCMKHYRAAPESKAVQKQGDQARQSYYKEVRQWAHIFRTYGLTKEGYLALLSKQNSCCAVCKKDKKLVVDHCHKTQRVRGLLCHGCNRDVSILDNPTLLESAKEYVACGSN